MLTPHTFRISRAGRPSALLLCGLLALAAGCTSIEGPTSDVDEWKASWRQRAETVADGAARGATAMGDSLGTAYEGVRDGFAEPDPNAYGAYPRDYAATVKRHMLRFEGQSEDSSFRFGRPVKGYSNKGILAGGEIDWQGWVVDVEVESTRFGGQKRHKAYVVRMRDGEVLEVLDADYASALTRVEDGVPASRAE